MHDYTEVIPVQSVRLKFISTPVELLSPARFIERTIFHPLDCFSTFVKNQLGLLRGSISRASVLYGVSITPPAAHILTITGYIRPQLTPPAHRRVSRGKPPLPASPWGAKEGIEASRISDGADCWELLPNKALL